MLSEKSPFVENSSATVIIYDTFSLSRSINQSK